MTSAGIGTYIQMGIDVDNTHWPAVGHVAEIVAERRLVAAAKDERHGPLAQDARDDRSQDRDR